jgi:hypothetical protein
MQDGTAGGSASAAGAALQQCCPAAPHLHAACDALAPPGEALRLMRLPVVQRAAPQLPCLAERVRRYAAAGKRASHRRSAALSGERKRAQWQHKSALRKSTAHNMLLFPATSFLSFQQEPKHALCIASCLPTVESCKSWPSTSTPSKQPAVHAAYRCCFALPCRCPAHSPCCV